MQIIPKEVVLEKKPLDKDHYRTKIFGGRIIGLSWVIDGKVLAAAGTDNFLRLFEISSLKVIGGGSLNKRLDGAVLTTMEVDQTEYKILLGSNKGTVMCYRVNIENFQLSYLYTIALGSGALNDVPVSALTYSYGSIFVGCGTQVIAYNVAGTKEPKTVIFCKNK